MLRPMLQYIKENSNTPLIGVEIGVFKGINSEEILKNMNIMMFYAIDPWEEYSDGNIFKKTVKENEMKSAEMEAFGRLSPFNNVRIIKKHSKDAAKEFSESQEVLDFLYIDGAHNFRNVEREIRLFYNKTKFIGGHDYNRKNIGVLLAVNLHYLFRFYKIKLYHKESDWWFVRR